MNDTQRGKEAAARYAATLVQHGMTLGLGSGSTAALFVRALGERVRTGLHVVGVPTSIATETLARAEGIDLSTLEETPHLDLAIDGADAVDPTLNLLKGLGGALLREKIVAAAAANFIIIVDEGKLVDALAQAPLVPVEVVPFGWRRTKDAIEQLGATATRRPNHNAAPEPFITDGGHFILDCHFSDIADPSALATRLKSLTGVVDHGFFIGMASEVVVGTESGDIRKLSSGLYPAPEILPW